MNTPIYVLQGGPFGGLRLPEGSLVVSDTQIAKQFRTLGYNGCELQTAKILVVELGRLQSPDKSAAGALYELVQSRHSSRKPTVFLLHRDHKYAWRHSRSDELVALMEALDATTEDWKGKGHIKLDELQGYAPDQLVDDGSVPDLDDQQPDYREYLEEEQSDWVD